MSLGMLGHFGLGKESTWGTAVAATDYIKIMSEAVQLGIDRFDQINVHASVTEPDDAAGVRRVTGNFTMPGHPVSLGHVLTGLLGNGTVNSLHTSLWRHDFQALESDVATSNPLPAYTFEIFRDVTTSQRYSGIQFTGATFSIQPNNPFLCSFDIIGKSASHITKTTPSFPTPAGNFDFSTASMQIAGAATPLIEALSITVNNSLEGVAALNNSNEIAKVKRQGPVLTNIEGTMSWDNITEALAFQNQTEQAFVVSMFLANSHSIVFDIPRLVYTAYPTGIPGRERMTVGFSGKGLYHTGSGSAMEVRLTTSKSDYAA